MSSKSKKKPLVRRVEIVTDDEVIEALGAARAELADAEQDAKQVYDRRIALARSANPPAAELLAIDERLDAEREEKLKPFREAVEAAEAAVRDATETYVFRSKGHRAYQDLLTAKEHVPTEEDHDATRKMTGQAEALALWHAETFEPALVALTCIEPSLTVEEATELRDEWNDDEFQQLFNAAYIVSRGRRQVDLGKALRAVPKPA